MDDSEKKILQRVCDFFDKLSMQDHPREQQWEYLAIRSELKKTLNAPSTLTPERTLSEEEMAKFWQQAEGRMSRAVLGHRIEPKWDKGHIEQICEFNSGLQVLKGNRLSIHVTAQRDFYPYQIWNHDNSDAYSVREFYVASKRRPIHSTVDLGDIIKAGSSMTIVVEAHRMFVGARCTLYGTRAIEMKETAGGCLMPADCSQVAPIEAPSVGQKVAALCRFNRNVGVGNGMTFKVEVEAAYLFRGHHFEFGGDVDDFGITGFIVGGVRQDLSEFSYDGNALRRAATSQKTLGTCGERQTMVLEVFARYPMTEFRCVLVGESVSERRLLAGEKIDVTRKSRSYC